MNAHLIYTCHIHSIEYWKINVSHNGCANHITDINDNKLNSESINFVGRPNYCDSWHRTCHQTKADGKNGHIFVGKQVLLQKETCENHKTNKHFCVSDRIDNKLIRVLNASLKMPWNLSDNIRGRRFDIPRACFLY